MRSINEQKSTSRWPAFDELREMIDEYYELLDWAERARKLIESNLDWLSDELYIGCELLKELPE